MRIFKIILLWILTALPGMTMAQQPFYKNYTIAAGLPSLNVYHILQDTRGYLWLATDNGLSRYDGKTFRNYTTADGLPDNEILQLQEDSSGSIWLLTMNGRACYIKNDSIFTKKEQPLLANAEMGSFYYSFHESESVLYFAAPRDCIRAVNITEGVYYKSSLPQSPYYITGSKHDMVVISAEGIGRLNVRLKDYELLHRMDMKDYISHATVNNGEIFFSNNRQLYCYDIQSDKIELLTVINSEYYSITSIDVDRNSKIWIGTRNGVLGYNSKDDLRDGNYTEYLQGRTVTKVLNDREGNLWFSTLEEGLFFTPSTDIISYMDKIHERKINCIEKDKRGRIWIGTVKNKYIILDNGVVKYYSLNKANRPDDIMNIHHYDDETWIVGKSGIKVVADSNSRYIPYWANDLVKDNDGNLWLGLSRCWYLPAKNIPVILSAEYTPSSYIQTRYAIDTLPYVTNAFGKDAAGTIWIGTNNGLFSYEKNTIIPQTSQAVLSGKITSIKTRNTKILVGTVQHGLAILSNDTDAQFINAKHGLSSNHVLSLYPENDSVCWIGTKDGLDKVLFHNDSFSVINYTLLAGLGTLSINGIEMSGDSLFLATDNGVISMTKQAPLVQVQAPLLHLTGFYLNNQKHNVYRESDIPYNKNNITIQFKSIVFRGEERLKYYYRINNNDKWRLTTTPEINMMAVQPGTYKFDIKAVNAYGTSSEILTINFTVLAPFWKSGWFVVTIIAVCAVLIFIMWSFRVRYLRKKFALEKSAMLAENENIALERDLKELEHKALRLQMNPHFIFNALNTIKGYYIENDSKQGNQYINKFSKLLRFILENEGSFITLDEEVRVLQLYLDLNAIRFKEYFKYSIDIDPAINVFETLIPSMLLQPFAENAVIHGISANNGKGKITIQFKKEGDLLICTLQDDGVGRTASASLNRNREHKSKGIEIVKRRLEVLSNSTNIRCSLEIHDLYDNEKAAGTLVIISIPLLKA